MRVEIAGIVAEIKRKQIKHLRIAVCPPDAQVEVSAPMGMDEDAIRLALIRRLPWIRAEQREMLAQLRLTKRSFVSGESHYFQGKRYLLKIIEIPAGMPHRIALRGRYMEMYVYASTSRDAREDLQQKWYRDYLREELNRRLPVLAEAIGVPAPTYQIRKMRTRWGTCNKSEINIQINTDLAMKHPAGLEYVLIHELCHLHETSHNERFIELLNHYCPNWKHIRASLNAEPLSYEDNWEED